MVGIKELVDAAASIAAPLFLTALTWCMVVERAVQARCFVMPHAFLVCVTAFMSSQIHVHVCFLLRFPPWLAGGRPGPVDCDGHFLRGRARVHHLHLAHGGREACICLRSSFLQCTLLCGHGVPILLASPPMAILLHTLIHLAQSCLPCSHSIPLTCRWAPWSSCPSCRVWVRRCRVCPTPSCWS